MGQGTGCEAETAARDGDGTGGRGRRGAAEGSVQQVQARAGGKPRPALSGPDHHGRMSGMRMQLSGHS